jgi:UPF0755 protein
MAKKKKKGFLGVGTIIILILLCIGGYYVYDTFFKSNLFLGDKKSDYLYIPTGTDYEDLKEILQKEGLKDIAAFDWVAKKMKLPENIFPGKYRVLSNMSNREIVNLLKYNKQEKVKVTLTANIHTSEEIIEILDKKFEMTESELENLLYDDNVLVGKYGVNKQTATSLIIPDTYEFSWATSAETFFNEMHKNYNAFWNINRLKQAANMNLRPDEVVTLAAIVYSESKIKSEQQKIAGVYLNRIKRDMLLQADPTVTFANGNFDVQRVTNSDKEKDSRYNTYKYKGLPPGPICLVPKPAIEATLNYVKHNYIFFCAKPELNGYSDFSVTYEQHEKYAKAYQQAMSKKGIFR